MANITVTEAANHIPEITINAANQGINYLGEYLNLGATVKRDFNSDFARKGDTLNITKTGNLTVNDKSANTDVTLQTPSDDVVTLTLDKHKEVSFSIEDAVQAQSIEGFSDEYARQAAMRLAETIEQDLADLYSSAGTTLSLSDYSNWPDALAAARRVLVSNKIPKNAPKYAQMDEYAFEDLLKENLIEDASQYGTAEALREGRVQRLRGINLFESQVVGIDTSTSPDTYYPVVYGEEGMAMAVRPLPDWGNGNGATQTTVIDDRTGMAIRATMSYDPSALAMQMTMDVLYGVTVLRAEHLVAISHQPNVDS